MFARTERLMLRPAWSEDAAAIDGLVRSERTVRDLFGSPAQCELPQPCRHEASGPDDLPVLMVFRRTAGAPELIGVVALEKAANREAQLVCWIARPHRRKGYGTEASRAVVHIAKEGLRLRRLVSTSSDRASAALFRKLGFDEGSVTLANDRSADAPAEPALQSEAA